MEAGRESRVSGEVAAYSDARTSVIATSPSSELRPLMPNFAQQQFRAEHVSVGSTHKLGSPEVQPGGLLCPRKQTSSDQPVRSGSRRVDIEARAFEEEPCFEDASGQTCNRVREAAMWAASLHTLMLPHRRLPPSSGLIPTWR